jgi:UDP-N-acetyl-D-glucosamine dehydrogenase
VSAETPPPDKVVVVGQGYVGLPVAMRAVELGFDIVGVDVDSD